MSRSRRPSGPLWLRYPLLIIALWVLGTPAWGYVVFFKDGSQITTKEKYRIEGDKALLVLPSGAIASYAASEIDVEKTEQGNLVDYGTARLLVAETKPAPKNPRLEGEDPTFGEFISGRNLALPKVRKRQTGEQISETGLPTTQAGFVDLMALRRQPYPHTEITSEVLGYLKGQGVDRVRIYQGTVADRPLLEVVAASEASVFKTLEDSANGLVQIHERFPRRVAAFELVMMTESQERAGQFLLTPELAHLLVSGRVKAPAFFLRYVEF